MKIEKFDYILNEIKEKIEKPETNFRKPIILNETLFVTIRYTKF